MKDSLLKILCLNVRSGGGSRWESILAFVEAHDADVVVFTEWRAGARQTKAEAWSSSRGMRSAFLNDGATKNGVFVAAKCGYIETSMTPGNQSAGALLQVQFDSWAMLACYFPQLEAKAAYFDVCRRVANDFRDQPLVIVGDMNTGNQVADKTASGTKYTCSDRFDQLSQIEGLADLWLRSNGTRPREWTWLTKQNGFRIDHAFGNQPFVDRFDPACEYDHRPRKDGFSDHSAVLISIEADAR